MPDLTAIVIALIVAVAPTATAITGIILAVKADKESSRKLTHIEKSTNHTLSEAMKKIDEGHARIAVLEATVRRLEKQRARRRQHGSKDV